MPPVGPPPPPAWALTREEALRALGTPASGLDEAEAAGRLERLGPNRLPGKSRRSVLALLWAQLGGLLNLTLVGAAFIAALIGDLKDGVMIGMVIAFNVVLGFLQEHRAERALAALKGMLARQARVRRAGAVRELPAEELVPGDLVLLEAGDRVPADGRLTVGFSLELDESTLTGESLAVAKRPESLADRQAPLAERRNMAFMNTVVTRGRGELLVTATGAGTEIGRLAELLETVEPAPTPLQRQLDSLGKRLALLAVAIILVISAFELARGESLGGIVLEAVALAVAAIPEGLPAVVTVTLALGVHRMARNRAIVKRMAGVETLGCTTVICTDKTGTLTLNQMTARAFWFRGAHYAVSGEGYRPEGIIERLDGPGPAGPPELEPLLLPLVLCNDSRIQEGRLIGDPTEGALGTLALKGGVEPDAARARLPRIAEVPFESERRFMATFHEDGELVRVFVKGAPDVIVEACSALLGEEGPLLLDEGLRAELHRENEALAARGLRVLAVASRTLPRAAFDPGQALASRVEGLTFLGLVGLLDPPRPEAREAIALCRAASIDVKMITGDHLGTAMAIASELGLSGAALTGAALEGLDDEQLANRVRTVAVFARVAPEHKIRLVRALQARRHVVAMTGDGVNDAPALKGADIGVAMGSGTEVAREAATVVLTDDNFATIVGAVKEGRTIYENIVKFVRFQLSTNVGALLSIFLAPLLGLPAPLKPLQILWVAMIMDGPPALVLGLDPARPDLMESPPRSPDERILSWARLRSLLGHGAVMAAGTLGLLALGAGGGHIERARTLAFNTFVLFQVFNVFNARAEGRSVFSRQLFTNRQLWVALALVLLLQVLVVQWGPLRLLFKTTPLSLSDWGRCAAVASSLLLLEELRKWLRRWVKPPRALRAARPALAAPGRRSSS